MSAPRCLVVLVWLGFAGTLSAQTAVPSPAASPAVPATDERAARVAERYQAMLAANPTEGLALDRLWKYHEEHGTTAALLDTYQKAANAPDADLAAMLVDGFLLKKIGRLDETAALYDRANKRDPASPLPWMAAAELASVQNHPDEAANGYAQALSKLPATDRRRTDLLLKQGAALLAAGKIGEAAGSWEKIVALNPADLAVRRQLADVYEKNGLADRAVAQYEYIEAHADPAERATACRELGRLQEAQGKFDAARDALERGLALTSRDNWLHGDLQTQFIHLYERAGRAPELATRWRAEVEKAPRDLGGYLRLEALAEAEGDAADKREALEKIVTLAPGDRENNLKLAALLVDGGERERAATLYDALLKRQPTNLDLILARADLDVQINRPAEAVSRVEARVAQSPADDSIAGPALNFFLDRHLDDAAERILRAEAARQPGAAAPSLALAKFLFAERRAADARGVLDALAVQPGTPGDRAARLAQVAEAFRQGSEPELALRSWRQAAALQPNNPAPLVAAAEVLQTDGDVPGATALLEQALALSPAGPEGLAVDHKLFETLPGGDEPARLDPEERGLLTGRTSDFRPARSSPLGRYLASLGEKADEEPTAEHFLRLARWQSWAHDDSAALRSAEKAIAFDPANIPARELAASVAIQLHQTDLAEQMLSQLLQLDPAHQSSALRELANLKLAAGDVEESLKEFQRLELLAPGSRSALADLALAEQRVDRWFDALETWERAYALPGGTPARREEIRRPLLAAYEHLGQFPRAEELLLRAVDEQTDLSAKEDLFRQLADFSHKHGLDHRLLEDFEARLRGRPDDYFTLVAMAQLRQQDGDPVEAYHLFQRAYYSSPDPAQSLRTLVQAGEELGETRRAITDQQRLLALPGQSMAENLERLAELQENDLEAVAATNTWNAIVARFPRETSALGHAADYFGRTGQIDRARDLQRQIVALDPSDLGRILQLALLDIRAGDLTAARGSYENILAHTKPEPPGEPLLLPDELKLPADYAATFPPGSGRFRLRTLTGGPGVLPVAPVPLTGGDQALRLEAIRALSHLLFLTVAPVQPDQRAQADWLARWQHAAEAGVRNEPLQAFYYAGNKSATMNLLAGWLDKGVADDALVRGAFLAAGLRLGSYENLAKWAWGGDDPSRQSLREGALLGALEQYLGAGGRPQPTMVAELFPPGVKHQSLLWETAKQFADLHWYAQAVELGQRAFALVPSGRAGYASDLAEWELYEGMVPAAREVLKAAAEEGGGSTFDANASPVLSDLRAYYLLLPTTERHVFVQDYLQRMQARGDKIHATLAAVLLHGLEGDEAAARHDLASLLATRQLASDYPGRSEDTRRWTFLLVNGVQLEIWNLPSLAAYLWRQALKEATAFDQQFGDAEGTLAEIRRRLLGVEVAAAANPEEARACVEEYLSTSPPTGTAASVAGEMLNDSQASAAIQIDRYLCRTEENDGEHRRALFAAYESAGEPDVLEGSLEQLLQAKGLWPEALPRADFVCRWAAAREHNGDSAGACRVLEDEQTAHPGTLAVLVQLAQTRERTGQWDRAVEIWWKALPLDQSVASVLNLANAEDHLGHREEAIQLLNDGLKRAVEVGRGEVINRLTSLYLAAGKTNEARELTDRVLREGPLDALPLVAGSFAAAGQQSVARELLTAAVRRTRDPSLQVSLQQALVGLCPVIDGNADDFRRQLARLEVFGREVPGFRNNWEVTKYKLACQAGADAFLEDDLSRRWDHGKGDYLAGERLAALYLAIHRDDRLGETIGEFDRRPMLPEQLLFGLENTLVQTGHFALALPISERLFQRFPQNEEYALQRATVLWKTNQHAEANHLLEAVAGTAVLRDDLTERVAQTYLSLGDKDRARESFEKAVQTDRAASRSPGSFLRLARLYLEAGRKSEAGSLLRTAYRQDSCDDFTPLVDYLSADGRLEGKRALEMPGEEFSLSFRRRALLLVAVSNRLEKDGRTEEARQLLFRHPGFLAEVPAAAAELCRNLSPAQAPQAVAALEVAVKQLQPPLPQLVRVLDALQARQTPGLVSEEKGGR